jgi:SAM-dependent methyltransferase
MSLRFYEIAERFHLIQNPITSEKLDAVGAGCRFAAGTRLLDLGCGRGEMLTRWAERYAITGTGVDISTTYLAEASRRAAARNVAESVRFVELDAARYFEENPAEQGAFDVVSCIGATWIGGGTPGTLAIMKQGLKDPSTGMLLVGDVYWHNPPTDEQIKAMGEGSEDWAVGLPGAFQVFNDAGYDVVQMELATLDSWDAYYSQWWHSVHTFLRENPTDPDGPELLQWINENQRTYITHERAIVGWGIFVLMPRLVL